MSRITDSRATLTPFGREDRSERICIKAQF
jgi:hypothetical protein